MASCVVLAAPGRPIDADLLAVLRRRDLDLAIETQACSAMARLCRLGKDTDGGLILLLVRPREIGFAAQLIRAAERYAPRAICWQYDPAGRPRLRAMTPEDLALPASEPAGTPRRVPTPPITAPSRLRLAGEGVLPAEPEPSSLGGDQPPAQSPPHALTGAELAMLLGEDLADFAGGRTPPAPEAPTPPGQLVPKRPRA